MSIPCDPIWKWRWNKNVTQGEIQKGFHFEVGRRFYSCLPAWPARTGHRTGQLLQLLGCALPYLWLCHWLLARVDFRACACGPKVVVTWISKFCDALWLNGQTRPWPSDFWGWLAIHLAGPSESSRFWGRCRFKMAPAMSTKKIWNKNRCQSTFHE